jgi:hypothetical protein
MGAGVIPFAVPDKAIAGKWSTWRGKVGMGGVWGWFGGR